MKSSCWKYWAHVFENYILPEQWNAGAATWQFGIHLHTHESLIWTSEMSSIRNACPLEPFMDSEKMSYDCE